MHLKRIRVPNFRVLQDVDITFETDLIPRIFPLGSINGGGKSTLLQLIFTLLHCCGDEQRIPYLQNMLDGFDLEDDSGYRDLATIDLVIDGQDLELKFFLCDWEYIDNNLEDDISSDADIYERLRMSINDLAEEQNLLTSPIKSIDKLREEMNDLSDRWLNSYSVYLIDPNDIRVQNTEFRVIEKIKAQLITIIYKYNTVYDRCCSLQKTTIYFDPHGRIAQESIRSLSTFNEMEYFISDFRETLNNFYDAVASVTKKILTPEFTFRNDDKCKVFLISTNSQKISLPNTILACCLASDKYISNIKVNLIKTINNDIFLAAPATQVFHFLTKRDRLLLFRTRGDKLDDVNYSGKLGLARAELQGFFPYDAFSPEFLIETLESAIDNDIKDIRSTGKYGDSYPKLVTELEQALSNQKVSVDLKAGTITFTKTDDRGNTVELYPEDLSHGELKRLSLYVWLKYNNIENAIVLMDEVEIALHPDWQYGMINDLQTWAPNNQYILATHSYEMCQALTPAHVKEIEPKLLKKQK